MGGFSILTNRKRAIVALVHSVVFLLIATWQIGASPARGIWAPATAPAGVWILCGVYAIVSVILLWLFAISGGWMEKAYFALCAVSAASGLLRTIIGDSGFHPARYIRVVMLASAAVVGLMIVRMYSETRRSQPELVENANS